MNKLKQSTTILLVALLIFSCKSKDLTSDFRIGMKEHDWKKAELGMMGADSLPHYNWNIGSNSFRVTAILNGDGIKAGDLRIVSLYLSASDEIDTLAQQRDKAIDTSFQYSPDLHQSSTCSESRFEKVLIALKEKFGNPDSTIYETRSVWKVNEDVDPFNSNRREQSGKDTTAWNYHFHHNGSIILLRRGKLQPQSKYIPFDHYESASVHEMSENYESQLGLIIESRRKLLRPKDLVSIPIYTSVGDNTNQFGIQEKVLILTAIVNEPISTRLAIEESRSIRSVKGRIVIKDNHGDSLLSYLDFKLDLQQPLKSTKYPGLKYVFDSGDFTELYIETRKAVFVRMNHPDVPTELKRAFNNGEKIKAVFIPESILFTDGSVLKK